MEKRKPTLRVVFYQESNGNEPVHKWLKALDKEMRRIIGEDMKKVQYRWPLGMPLVRSLGNKLWEVRSAIPNGIARIIFIVVNNKMVLLHGLIKKTQKTPLQDINLAWARSKNYEEQEDDEEK